MRSSNFVVGILICLTGSILFSTKAVLVKLAYRETNIDAISLLALRMVFSLPFFVVSAIVASAGNNKRFTIRQWFMIAAVGCLGYYVSSLLDFLGLQYISAGIERLVLFVYPTLVLLISFVLFGQKISRQQWIAVAITYAGLLLAFSGEIHAVETGSENFYKGVVLVFACAVTFALYIVGSGRLIPHVGAARFNSYAMSFACAGVLIHFFVSTEHSLLNLSGEVYLYSALMALFSTILPSYLVTEGIRRVGSGNAAIISSIGPVSTIVQANIFLYEPIVALQIAGTVLVLIGILLIGKKDKTKFVEREKVT